MGILYEAQIIIVWCIQEIESNGEEWDRYESQEVVVW